MRRTSTMTTVKSMTHATSLSGGFTLIELMVTLAVAAIMLALAVPSFTTAFNQNRLAGTSNDILASLQGARMEAVRRNVRTVMCRSTDGATCSAGAQWTGWITYADTNRNGALNAGELLQVGTVRQPLQVRVSAAINNSQVVFRPDGLAYSAGGNLLVGTVAVCLPTDNPNENERRVGIVAGSRFGITKFDTGSLCVAPPNS